MIKTRIKTFLSAFLIAYSGGVFAQSRVEISIESLLNQMVNRDLIAKFPKTNFRLKQQSSYSRESKTPQDTGKSGSHTQVTCHFAGDPAKLDQIAQKLFLLLDRDTNENIQKKIKL